jgi:hypothetical protein
MKYNINIEDAPDHEIGLEIMRVLNLKGDKINGRVQTTHGDKNPCGLARTVRNLSAGQLEKAAPDMLAALRDVVEELKHAYIINLDEDAIGRAKTAIAKAEGN